MIRPRPDRSHHGQLVSNATTGDCFRASMSVLLGVPNGDHLPNDHAEGRWIFSWFDLLADLGLAVHFDHSGGPIWKGHPWLASVPSKNEPGCTHAIVMDHHQVLFDPSPRRRYHAGHSLLGKDVVLGGTWLEVADATKLDRFVEWQRQCWELA